MPKKLTREEFIKRGKALYGDYYDYSKAKYVNLKTPVTIICPIHGEWQSRPYHFLAGHQCIRCSAIRSASVRKLDTQSFIKKAKLVHGGRYDYSVTKYKSGTEKVAIICKKHGVFYQVASGHLAGHGCPKCSFENNHRLVAGTGVVDVLGEYDDKSYSVWRNILERCYNEKYRAKFPTYRDCSVCKEWLKYSNFKRWYSENYVEGYNLDKDILVKGNKLYSPETCCFVPQEINKLFLRCGASRGDLPIGVCRSNSPRSHKLYRVYLRKKRIGDYYTVDDAFKAYKQAKEAYIKEVASEYYSEGKITKRVYDAMLQYEVEITD